MPPVKAVENDRTASNGGNSARGPRRGRRNKAGSSTIIAADGPKKPSAPARESEGQARARARENAACNQPAHDIVAAGDRTGTGSRTPSKDRGKTKDKGKTQPKAKEQEPEPDPMAVPSSGGFFLHDDRGGASTASSTSSRG